MTVVHEPKRAMIFKGLNIRRLSTYDDRPGKLTGTISFSNDMADISLNLTEEHCRQLLAVCADALVDSVREVAQLLTTDCIIAKAEVSTITDVKAIA